MKTIAVLSRKGGAGKTTFAVHLSIAAEQAGHTTVLIGLDPQESAMMWKDNRELDTPSVISAHATRLPKLLKTAEQKWRDAYDFRYCVLRGIPCTRSSTRGCTAQICQPPQKQLTSTTVKMYNYNKAITTSPLSLKTQKIQEYCKHYEYQPISNRRNTVACCR